MSLSEYFLVLFSSPTVTFLTASSISLFSISSCLFIVAIITAVIVGLVIAIKFITGSVIEKAEVKETLTPYIAGCVVVFGAFGIWKLVVTILNQTVQN